ncbi:hypothetical protein JTB14_012847 [Gonioctena quinquepunctata]|nr:hypothetical protein JTB14_012847 [Gonioctena quinquepunctata]
MKIQNLNCLKTSCEIEPSFISLRSMMPLLCLLQTSRTILKRPWHPLRQECGNKRWMKKCSLYSKLIPVPIAHNSSLDMLEVPRTRATSESNEDPEPELFKNKLRDRAKLHKPEKYDAFAMLAADEPNNIEEALASTEAGMKKRDEKCSLYSKLIPGRL